MRFSIIFVAIAIDLMSCLVSASSSSNSTTPIKFFIFREDCFDKFFNKMEFNDKECLKFTVATGIGLAIILGSGIVKLPQIFKIHKSGSV
jgi:hypothetical protein